MRQWKLLLSTLSMGVFWACGALANITAEQVWEDIKSALNASGHEVTVQSMAREGDVLVVHGVRFSLKMDMADATVTSDKIVLTDKGDGRVLVTDGGINEYDVKQPASALLPGEKALGFKGNITKTGFEILVSGTPDAMIYDFSMPTGHLMAVNADGAEVLDVGFDIDNLKGQYFFDVSDETAKTGFSFDRLKGRFATREGADIKGMADINLDISAGSSEQIGKIIKDFKDLSAMEGKLKSGGHIGMKLSYKSLALDAKYDDGSGRKPNFMMSYADKGADGALVFDAQKFDVKAAMYDAALKMSGKGIPVAKAEIAFNELGINYLSPVLMDGNVGDFSVGLKLSDMSFGQEIWDLFDAGQKLPHDPMSFLLDMKGVMRLQSNLFEGREDAPILFESITLHDFMLSAIGTHVAGKGDFTFDNGDKTKFIIERLPTQGKAAFQAEGLNKLFDRLVDMNFIPQEQIAGFRMLMGLAVKPVEGKEDAFVSDVEFENGILFVNGMQMQ